MSAAGWRPMPRVEGMVEEPGRERASERKGAAEGGGGRGDGEEVGSPDGAIWGVGCYW
jgi:hypothetical protein